MDGTGKLAEALARAQAAMHPAKMDAKNPFFGFRYATLSSVWGACRDALTANGLAVVQQATASGAQVSVTSRLLHTSGESVDGGTLSLTAKDASPQAVGSALTYARRYSLAALVGVCPDENDDANGAQEAEPPAPKKPTASCDTIVVDQLSQTTGGSGDKTWTRTAVKSRAGAWYSTFDSGDDLQLLRDSAEGGLPVNVFYELSADGKYKNLVAVESHEEAPL